MSRPSRSAKFNALIAFWASAAVCISMNALRRLIPVAESRSSLTDNTVPNLPNLPARVSSVAESGRLFTWSLVLTVGPLVGERQRIRLAPVYRKSNALARLVAGRQHTARPPLVVGAELARLRRPRKSKWSGGGGGNRTRVRKCSAVGSTCLFASIVLTASNPTDRAH